MKNFTKFNLNFHTVDNYVIRTAIFHSLKLALKSFEGKLLDVGCGKMPYKNFIIKNSRVNDYIGLDLESTFQYDDSIKPDAFWNGKEMPFKSNTFDTVIATEVLEHCFEPEIILNEIHRVLKPNGVFFFTVPFLWNLHETPYDAYRYTPYALKRHLEKSGFSDISIESTGGWHASMAQMLGLWVKRSSMSIRKRKFFSFFIVKIIPVLLKYDSKRSKDFKEGQMITGLCGIVKK